MNIDFPFALVSSGPFVENNALKALDMLATCSQSRRKLLHYCDNY